LAGSTNSAGFGKIVNANSLFLLSFLLLPSLPFLLEDFKQALRTRRFANRRSIRTDQFGTGGNVTAAAVKHGLAQVGIMFQNNDDFTPTQNLSSEYPIDS